MELISIIVPCYNEQEVLPMFYDEITKTMNDMKVGNSQLDFELLFISSPFRE